MAYDNSTVTAWNRAVRLLELKDKAIFIDRSDSPTKIQNAEQI
jgi:hypothetical protein